MSTAEKRSSLLLAVVISDAAPRLKVSENKRFLVREDGSPFFYLGDTAWELFHRLKREEAGRYLEDRARKGFTVIHAVTLGPMGGVRPRYLHNAKTWRIAHSCGPD
jgi:hypothetical protein